MGTVVKLKNQINDSYFRLKNSVEDKLVLTEEKIKSKLSSDVELVQKMTNYHIETGGKRLRALLTLGSAKLCGYIKGSRDINLAACVELIHSATLMHDDVIDEGAIRRGKDTLNKVWNNHSSVLIGDYLLSRCFEMMVEDGNLEVLKLLSSTSSKIAHEQFLTRLMIIVLKLLNYHLLPSFQNIYLTSNHQSKQRSDCSKLYLMYLFLFLWHLHLSHRHALMLRCGLILHKLQDLYL